MDDPTAATVPPASRQRVVRPMTILSLPVFSIITVVTLWLWPVNGWGALIWLAGIVTMGIIRRPFAEQVKS